MEIEALVNLIMNNGIGFALVAYLVYFNNKITSQQNESYKELSDTLKEVSKSMNEMGVSMVQLNERINNLELCKRENDK